jgi:dienelactone hydrolase
MIVFVSDIYGSSSSLKRLISDLRLENRQFLIAEPYNGMSINFETSEQAYKAFLNSGGIEQYIFQLKSLFDDLLERYKSMLVIGFSAGGAASYKVMNSLFKKCQISSVLFYPGQIRYYLKDTCNFSSTIIFPKNESHFKLAPVAAKLAEQTLVEVIQTQYEHGFMNHLSLNFNNDAYQEYLLYLRKRIDNTFD